jgi:hypothetical protein
MSNIDEIEKRARALKALLRTAKREQFIAAGAKDTVKWGHQRKMRRAARYKLTRAKDAAARARRGRAQWLRINQL